MSNITQWRNIAELTTYPFMEGASPSIVSLIIDARINVPAESDGVYLKKIVVEGDKAVFTISSVEGEELGSGRATIGINRVVDIANNEGAHIGVIVVSESAKPLSEEFTPLSARFETSCTAPSSFRKVSSIDINKKRVCGKIALAEGDGIRLVKMSDESVRVDAVGSTVGKEKCCPEKLVSLRQINDAVPDKYGSILFTLLPYDEPSGKTDLMQSLRIAPTSNGLMFYIAK